MRIKTITIIGISIAAAVLVPITATAFFQEGPYTYTVDNGQATIIDFDTAYSGDLTIASSLGGYSVTSIGDYAFRFCATMTSVVIGNSVTSIGDGAFWGCTSLTSVTIPDSVTSIGIYAFRACTSLTSVTIPDSVTSIGHSAFWGCTSLTSVTIPDSVTSIGNGAFRDCTSLTSVTIPDSVTSIGNGAFWGCTSLTSVTIPDSVTSIGVDAFLGCTSLSSVTIPDSVTSIGDGAFLACTSLESVVIGNSVTSIGLGAFYGCTSLTSVTIPDSVISIGGRAFLACTSLESVYFCGTPPSSVPSGFIGTTATLYYLPRHADQWPETYADHPSALWLAEITKADINAATRDFLLTVFWAPGQNVAIEAATRLVDPDWTTIHAASIPPSGLLEFPDPDAVDHCHRFYRVVGLAPAPSGMVLIPGGTNAGTNADTHPDFGAYSLTVTSFYMDRYEVTNALWDEVYQWAVTHGGYRFDNAGSGKAANHPVHTVNWYDVVKWCNARSEKEGRSAVYTVNGVVYRTGRSNNVVQTSAVGYRLPTDVEWEYAARGGLESKRFPWGDTIQHARANYWSSSSTTYDTSPTRGYHHTYATGDMPHTSPVGSFAANGYGLYDMAGNVGEWCFDWHRSYVGSGRVRRGGCWGGYAGLCRVASSRYDLPDYAYYRIGFRSVLPPGQQ